MSATESETTRFPPRRISALLRNRAFLTFIIVALVWVVAGFAKPGFGSFGHLRYLLELAAVIGLVAIGQTFVVIAGGIDLSVGAIVTVSAVGVPLVADLGDPTGTVPVLIVLAAASGIGLLNGLGVAYLRVHPMIMTLAMATFLQGVLILVAGGSAVSAQNPLLHWFGNARPIGIPAGVYLWVVVSAITLVVLHATPFGARIFAIGANPLATALSGVNTRTTTMAVYAIGGLTAGLAGVLLLGMNGQGYVGIGDPYLLASIAAVVLGGTSILGGSGTYAGTIPGAILLVTITALITVVNASPGWRSILFGSLILALLLFSGRESRGR
ncbi:ABC transporter permease [Bauldia litoralis]|uniref:Ribose transport system permease protein n=1 Tax=Bauldia litoralis TaxID=665467 RepID=A0A1G6BRR5_9HYPH|nr:ABC transporter permease [Bauldia litoralis]SDB23333.1 ribose transport system permease protein [Bauldia litoralis]